MNPQEVIRNLIDLAYYWEGVAAESGTGAEMIEMMNVQTFLQQLLTEPYDPTFPETSDDVASIYRMIRDKK